MRDNAKIGLVAVFTAAIIIAMFVWAYVTM